MATTLEGKKVLILSTNYGTETSELLNPLEYLREHGAQVTVAAPQISPIQTLEGDKEPGATLGPDITLADANPADYEAVVVPGGTLNADALRVDADAQRIVQGFANNGKVVASICHGPWLLINAGIAGGKTLTSYPTISTDLVNAGATWVNQEVKLCRANGYRLIIFRSPQDLAAFDRAIADELTHADA